MNAVGDKVPETCFGDTCEVKSPKVGSSSRLKALPLPPADPERPGNWALPRVGQQATTSEYAQKCTF